MYLAETDILYNRIVFYKEALVQDPVLSPSRVRARRRALLQCHARRKKLGLPLMLLCNRLFYGSQCFTILQWSQNVFRT